MLSKSKVVGDFLDINTLEEGREYCKVCYLERLKAKVSEVDTGFYTLVFKDINAATIVGNLWFKSAGDNFIDSGEIANKLKRKPVKITFRAEVFNGSFFLKVWDVESYSGDFPYTKFIGVVENAQTLFDSTSNALKNTLQLETNPLAQTNIDSILNQNYINDSLPQVYNGKCGGYVKLLQMVFYDMISYEGLPNVVLKDLIAIFYGVQDRYYRYLKREDIDILTNTDKLNFIYDSGDIANDTASSIIKGALGSLTGCFEANYLYSILVAESFKKNMKILNMCNTYTTMVKGMKKEMGDLCLVKI